MVGVIPVAGSIDEFGLEWTGTLMPVAPNYTALEAAIFECTQVGCTSIWIVCNDDEAPLIRSRVGEFAVDQDSIQRGTYLRYGSSFHKDIPIYYVPIHPKHRDKCDCYAWSIIYGANVAYWICKRFSRWVVPDTYYVSFPLGMSNPIEMFDSRKFVRSRNPFYFSYEDKTVKDGLPLSFTFQPDEWRRAKHVITTNSKLYAPPEEGERMPRVKLPPEERRISRWFTLKDVFGGGPEGTVSELSWFYDLTQWSEYGKFIGSEHNKRIKRPSKLIMYKRGTGGIANDR